MPQTATLPQDPGPFSSLFNYDDEAAKEEARQAQLEESQKKIMRTNAIGDAFRLLVDGIGGSQGATITPKPINPGIQGAASRLMALRERGNSNLERLRMTDLAIKTRDVANNQQLAETAAANRFKLGEENRKRNNELTDIGTKRGYEITDQGDKRKEQLVDQGTAQKNRIAAQDHAALNTRETNKQYLADQAVVLSGGNANRDRSIPEKGDIPFVIPGMKQTIYINPLEIQKIMPLVIGNKQKWDPSLDAASKALITNDAIKDGSALLTLTNNWDKVKGFFGYPEDITPPVTPEEQRVSDYKKQREKILDDAKLTPRERSKKVKTLMEEFEAAPKLPDITPVTTTEQKGDFQLKPDQLGIIQKVTDTPGYSKEQKRSAVYDYLIKQGRTAEQAKVFSEYLYDNLK